VTAISEHADISENQPGDNSLLDLARTSPMDPRLPPRLSVRAQAAQIMLGNAGEHGGLLAERLDIRSPETCGGASGWLQWNAPAMVYPTRSRGARCSIGRTMLRH
jgi:hypothetical protein